MAKIGTRTHFIGIAARSEADTVLILPNAVSAKLPSKGMTSVEGTINGFTFITILEPDGKGGHLLRLDQKFQKRFKTNEGDEVTLEITPAEKEIEMRVPTDLQVALDKDPEVMELWQGITTLARREWIHWIASAKQSETRQRRVDQTRSKLKDGKKRPCCFNYTCAIVSYEPDGLKA